VALRRSGVSLPPSVTVGLGGVVPWSLDRGCVQRFARRDEASSDAMAVQLARSANVMQILTMKTARRFDVGDDIVACT
jgi:hypothetical protein